MAGIRVGQTFFVKKNLTARKVTNDDVLKGLTTKLQPQTLS